MYAYDRMGQLASEHHREMLADARQRRLRPQHSRPASRPLRATSTLTRRLVAAIARADSAPRPAQQS
jgi:hypothetical protein